MLPQYLLPKLESNSLPTKYELGIDVSPQPDSDLVSYFRFLIGMMCWMVNLGCIDVVVEFSLILPHLALPR